MTAYVTSSSDFKTYTYGDAKFDCWLGTPQYQFYPSDTGFTRSDVFYGFHLSNLLNFSSSSASFSYSFDIPTFAFANVNMPTKFGFFICNKYTLDKILWLYLGGGYKTGSIFDCADLYYLNSATASADDPRLGVYAYNFVTYSSAGFTVSGDCVTDDYASDLVCVLGSYSDGKLRNYSYLPTAINIMPFGDTLQQLKDNQYHQDVIGSNVPGQESGIKGILQKIKDLPQLIADKLKDLFVPTDEQLSDFQTKMKALLADHFGALYQSSDIISMFFQKLKDFDPYQPDSAAGYELKFKPHDFYINVDSDDEIFSDSDNGGEKISLIPVGSDGYYHFSFAFLDSKPYKQIYTMYKAFVTVLFLIWGIYFCKRKYDSFLGGDVN